LFEDPRTPGYGEEGRTVAKFAGERTGLLNRKGGFHS
jgi:hypothetical protein